MVKQGPMRLQADAIRMDGKTGSLSGIGHIHYFDGQNSIDAERITLHIDTNLGILYNGKLFIASENYHIEGEEIIRHAPDQYEFKESSFTACDCQEDPAWRIRSKKIDLTVDGYLFAQHTRFYIRDIPFFYLPYFFYPVKRERQTGLLVPTIGFSSERGFRYEQDLFWAISDNQDATLSVEHRGDKGNGLGLEYRYVPSKRAHGEIKTEYFRDREENLDRWELRMNHEQRFTSRVQGKLNIQYVNEFTNFTELSDNTLDRARQNIESNLSLTYRGNMSYAYLLARYTQDLTQSSNDATPQRLPEIGYSLIEYHPWNAPFYLNLDTTAVNFWSEGGLNLQRIDLYPKISLPIRLGYGLTLTPWAGFRETWYSDSKQEDDGVAREITPSGITLGAESSKKWGKTLQRIDALIMYENIAIKDEDDIIQIDELDTLHERQTITATLGHRFLKSDHDGQLRDLVVFRTTETYYLDDLSDESLASRRFSDLRTGLELRPWSHFSLEIDTFYDLYDHRMTSLQTDFKLTFPRLSLAVGQRSTREGTIPKKGDLFNTYFIGNRETVTPEVDFWSGELSISTPWGIYFVNKAFYDADQNELVEVDYILQYQTQCWGLSFSYLNFHDRNEFSFAISISGLGAFGSGLLE